MMLRNSKDVKEELSQPGDFIITATVDDATSDFPPTRKHRLRRVDAGFARSSLLLIYFYATLKSSFYHLIIRRAPLHTSNAHEDARVKLRAPRVSSCKERQNIKVHEILVAVMHGSCYRITTTQCAGVKLRKSRTGQIVCMLYACCGEENKHRSQHIQTEKSGRRSHDGLATGTQECGLGLCEGAENVEEVLLTSAPVATNRHT